MEEILPLIEQYYHMKDGEFIQNYDNFFIVFDDEIGVRLRYKTIKHIVESRKRDNYTIENIVDLLKRVPGVLFEYRYKVFETKNNSYLLVETGVKGSALVIVLDINHENDSLHIKTAFFRAVTKSDKTKNPPR